MNTYDGLFDLQESNVFCFQTSEIVLKKTDTIRGTGSWGRNAILISRVTFCRITLS